MTKTTAIKKINEHGLLLVFPKNNQKEPHSLWSEFHPKTKLKWEWDDDGDQSVFEMWAMMKELSECREVVYAKWYQARATFFSREAFVAILAAFKQTHSLKIGLSESAHTLLSQLEIDSPLSTRELKKLTDLQGKFHEPTYSRAMKDLFSRLLVVAFGEVDDGAFPSLAVGATSLIFEDLWQESNELSSAEVQKKIDRWLPEGTKFRVFFDKIRRELQEK